MRWYLDFDGVLCDSVPEIWAVSRLAVVPSDRRSWRELPKDEKDAFLKLRPFVRRGAEYLPLQRALVDGSWKTVTTLEDWKKRLEGSDLETDHQTLYRLRSRWLETDPSGWTALNPYYPGIPEALRLAEGKDDVIILSTKKPEYIRAILKSWGVAWPETRIEYAVSHKASFLDSRGQKYLLLDDQIDQLDFHSAAGRCVLAAWGFVTPEALREAKEVWSLERFLDEFRKAWSDPNHR